jgi:hypothetical protein
MHLLPKIIPDGKQKAMLAWIQWPCFAGRYGHTMNPTGGSANVSTSHPSLVQHGGRCQLSGDALPLNFGATVMVFLEGIFARAVTDCHPASAAAWRLYMIGQPEKPAPGFLWPVLRGVPNAPDFDGLFVDAVDGDVGHGRKQNFARSLDASRPAKIGRVFQVANSLIQLSYGGAGTAGDVLSGNR